MGKGWPVPFKLSKLLPELLWRLSPIGSQLSTSSAVVRLPPDTASFLALFRLIPASHSHPRHELGRVSASRSVLASNSALVARKTLRETLVAIDHQGQCTTSGGVY
jgi:hypothetical protein